MTGRPVTGRRFARARSEKFRPRRPAMRSEMRHHGRYADEPQELIHGKHRCRPPRQKGRLQQPASVCAMHRPLISGQKLIRVGRAGDREQCQNRNDSQRFHDVTVNFDCGQKCQSLAHFQENPGNIRGCCANVRSTRKAASVFRRRYAEVPDKRPPHAFIIAEPCPPRHLDHAADVAAFEQQSRGLDA